MPRPVPSRQRGGPLVGIRIIEPGRLGPAPHGGTRLADIGAEVVRIDRPGERVLSGNPRADLLARGKRSVALDLKKPADRDVALLLLDDTDVLTDPYRPGVAERLGVRPDECLARNPRFVFVRMTGWGRDGSWPVLPAMTSTTSRSPVRCTRWARTRRPPPAPLNLVGDFGGSMLPAYVTAALFERERSGLGQVVDVAIVDRVASLLASRCQLDAQGLWSRERGRNWLDGAAPGTPPTARATAASQRSARSSRSATGFSSSGSA